MHKNIQRIQVSDLLPEEAIGLIFVCSQPELSKEAEQLARVIVGPEPQVITKDTVGQTVGNGPVLWAGIDSIIDPWSEKMALSINPQEFDKTFRMGEMIGYIKNLSQQRHHSRHVVSGLTRGPVHSKDSWYLPGGLVSFWESNVAIFVTDIVGDDLVVYVAKNRFNKTSGQTFLISVGSLRKAA